MRKEQIKSLKELKKIDRINIDSFRNNQYYFANTLFNVATYTETKTIYVLNALLNSGKSHTITNNAIPLLFHSDKDMLFITSYYGSVVDQFKKDMLTKSFADTVKTQLRHDESILLLVSVNKNETFYLGNTPNTFGQLQNLLYEWSDERLLVMDINTATPFDLKRNIKNNTKTIMVGTLQGTGDKVATLKSEVIREIVNGKKLLTIVDEIHAGMPCHISGKIGYKESTGHSNEEAYNAVYVKSLSEINDFNLIIGISATPTKAHIKDSLNYIPFNDLVIKEEIKAFSKTVEFFDVSKLTKEKLICDAIEDTIRKNNMINTLLGTKDRKYIVCPIVIPNDRKGEDNVVSAQFVSDILAMQFNMPNAVSMVTEFFGTSGKELHELVKDAESETNPLMFILVKQKFAAGINIKNITNFVMVRESVNPGKIWRSLIQLWGRGLRPNNTYSDNKVVNKMLNVCNYYITYKHFEAYHEFVNYFAFEENAES